MSLIDLLNVVWPANLTFVVFLILNSILWPQSRYGNILHSALQVTGAIVARVHHGNISSLLYSVDPTTVLANAVRLSSSLTKYRLTGSLVCAVVASPRAVMQSCAEQMLTFKTLLPFHYHHRYFCAAPPARPLSKCLLAWLIFLFSTLLSVLQTSCRTSQACKFGWKHHCR